MERDGQTGVTKLNYKMAGELKDYELFAEAANVEAGIYEPYCMG